MTGCVWLRRRHPSTHLVVGLVGRLLIQHDMSLEHLCHGTQRKCALRRETCNLPPRGKVIPTVAVDLRAASSYSLQMRKSSKTWCLWLNTGRLVHEPGGYLISSTGVENREMLRGSAQAQAKNRPTSRPLVSKIHPITDEVTWGFEAQLRKRHFRRAFPWCRSVHG